MNVVCSSFLHEWSLFLLCHNLDDVQSEVRIETNEFNV